MLRRLARACGVVTALACVSSGSLPAFAQTREIEPRLAVRVGAAATDNLARVASADAESATFATAGIDIGFLRETPRARAYADGTIDYFAYDSDEFSNETAGMIDTGLSLHVVPDAFTWDFNERLDHTRIDPFSPVGPGNRERINLFSTGPRATVALGESGSLGIVAQYTDRRYRELEALDGPTRTLVLEIGRDLSAGQRFSFAVAGADIAFDDPGSVPYEIHDAYLTFEQSTSGGSFAVSGGASRLRRQEASDSEPYFQLEWVRDLTSRSRISLSAGQHFYDAGTLESYEAGGVGGTLLTPDPRMTTDAGLTYTLTRSRAVFTATREKMRERYVGGALPQRDAWLSSAGIDYRFTPVLLGGIELVDIDEKFEPDLAAEEQRVRASVQRRIGRAWEGSLILEYNSRSASLGAPSFNERRYTLSLAWSPPR